jgi:serine/threonine protein kinase
MTIKLLARYDVVNELARSPLGVMYLATDTRMSRLVAVKKIGPVSMSKSEELLREARAASTLHHHAIVPVYDLGAVEGAVYLVYTLLAGETLNKVLQRSGAMAVADAVNIVSEVLDALAYAHGQGILHLDIKPSNVFIASDGQHYVLEFGIAHAMSKIRNATDSKSEASVFMAPEVIARSGSELRSDIYSAGMLLQEMLQGAASDSKMKIDDGLQKIIRKATDRNLANRYFNALEMRQALMDFMASAKAEPNKNNEADVSSTLKFLLRRIKSKSDFPAISGVINEINKTVASDTEDSGKLAQIILQDFSLTNKLLKLVNTASYSQFGGKISTVSKAVSILGFDTVRNIATTLVVMDFLQNKSQSQELKDVVTSSFLSSIVAIKLSAWKSIQEVEEAMICSMFFNLGKLLANFYFFDESEEVARLIESRHISEDKAAIEVLGISYNELGLGIARSWNFPESLISGMQKINDNKVLDTEDNYSRLNVAVNMANDLCSIANVSNAKGKESALSRIKARYAIVTDTSDEKIATVLAEGVKELSQRAKVFEIDTTNSAMLGNMKLLVAHTAEVAGKSGKTAATPAASSLTAGDETVAKSSNEVDGGNDAEAFLKDGLQDVINTMTGEYKLNDILQMVLETTYRGMDFRHVMILSRDNKRNLMVARFGFGENIVSILPEFNFPLKFEADVFHLTLEKGLDVVIEDVGAENIASKIPAWHSKAVDSRYFLLLPMVLNKLAIGIIYADMQEARKLKISTAQMALLRNLRDQAVLAIKQKSQG